jgi:hypothetical protein
VISRSYRIVGPIVAAAVLTLSGCSIGDTPDGVAKKLIEGELATQLGLGQVTATCDKPPNSDVGTTFNCTSTSDVGAIQWKATMTDAKTVSVDSTNLIRADVLPQVEAAAASALAAQVGGLDASAVDCGTKAVVLAADQSMLCAVTDPGDGTIHDATLTFTDVTTGKFNVDVSPTARS